MDRARAARDEVQGADERPVPKYLNQAIAIYLTYARPILLGQREFMIGDADQGGSPSSPARSGSESEASPSGTRRSSG